MLDDDVGPGFPKQGSEAFKEATQTIEGLWGSAKGLHSTRFNSRFRLKGV
jgi:hypothetical protein